ncbi:molybdopterin-binding domain of aldehyde dehydrogenase family protein [Paraburkholderia fungorum]|uniref:Molybdopterin-binding domain of aldehyde dehydrogenase family protein n=1 Tax=Paraburkholderia fungorum TaxID=134537 RepID=A0AAU8T080_9BURK|nr:molybdopterin cofactor-binding domain-containing protein [Paraburkholderia fungorum]AJZ57174.1 molybdopterin-binding domain of aldehyde dehydrogenase family protein [Paraburkholderia fungorum]
MPALRRLEPKYRHCFVQVPHLVRKQPAESLRIDKSAICVSASDAGGGFGTKLGAFPEDVLACLGSVRLMLRRR